MNCQECGHARTLHFVPDDREAMLCVVNECSCGAVVDGNEPTQTVNLPPSGQAGSSPANGTKFDQGKTRLSLISQRFLREMGHVLRHGAVKYSAHNWRKGLSVSRCLDAALRHLGAAAEGADFDPETGDERLNQLAQAAINCMFAFEMIADHPELDDRWKGAKS